jgi:hypothetical protein
MLEVEVVHHRQRGHIAAQGEVAVGTQEGIGLQMLQLVRQQPVEPEPVQQRMPRGWEQHMPLHVVRIDELGIECPVEQEQELVLRMRLHDALQGLVREPPDALQFVG